LKQTLSSELLKNSTNNLLPRTQNTRIIKESQVWHLQAQRKQQSNEINYSDFLVIFFADADRTQPYGQWHDTGGHKAQIRPQRAMPPNSGLWAGDCGSE